MSEYKRLLVTGAAGRIGTTLRNELSRRFEVRGLDRVPFDGNEGLVADMTDYDSIRAAFEDQDVVVDLSNDPRANMPWETAYDNNIPATWNSLRAAQEAGVRRYIYTSSNRVVEGYELDEPYAAICRGDYSSLNPKALPLITTDMPPRPSGPYAVSKILGEAAARYFSDRHGMSVLCLRLGTVDFGDGKPRSMRHFGTYLTFRDLIHLYSQAIDAPSELRWGVFFGVSDNTWRFWDISDARTMLSYNPSDNVEVWRGVVNPGAP